MSLSSRPWQESLEIIDRTMRAISSITDPEKLVDAYYGGIGALIPVGHYCSASRRNVAPGEYILTRSSRFTEHPNPWTERHRLPRMRGGVLGEAIYANRPMIIDDLPQRLAPDDPAHFYLEGFQSMISLPQYDNGESLNITALLIEPEREFDRSIIPVLHWHAALFGRGTTNQVLRNQLKDALDELDRELQVVGQIQRSLLPAKLPNIPGFDLAAHYLTSARAGGDYYDFFPLDGGKWGAFIADVSGHGTPAAVLMAITHALAHARPDAQTPPAALLAYLNERLTRAYTRGGTFVTAFYAILDPTTRTLTFSRAGHNPPRLVRDGKVISIDDCGGLPLGIDPTQTYEQATLKLEHGDVLLLYTDGITEAVAPVTKPDESRQLFGVRRLDELVLSCASAETSGRECIDRIRAALAEFTGNAAPNDDQTLIAMTCK